MKIKREFYFRSAEKVAEELLGKYLVFNSPKGRVSGQIIEVEAYPAFVDSVSHGNKRIKRTEVMYEEGGRVYVYLIYGIYYQFAVVVNKKDVPEVVLIRALLPDEGCSIMKRNYGREVKSDGDLTKSPGILCRAFGIDKDLYGEDITGDRIYIEDRGSVTAKCRIYKTERVGISKKLRGHDLKLRFVLK